MTRRHAHTRPASHPESLQVCVCELLHLRGLPVFVFIYTYTVFIYIFCVTVFVSGVWGFGRAE